MSAAGLARPDYRNNYGSRIVTNHEQGRKFFCKIQRSIPSGYTLNVGPRGGFLK